MQQLNIAILGGSNSLIRGGYTALLPEVLKHSGVDCQVLNLAVGANTCLRGLSTALQNDLSVCDVIVVEYFINDYSFYAHCGSEAWMAAYEGLIRHLLAKYPKTLIVPLILGRRDPGCQKVQQAMRADLLRLLDNYGIRAADFDQLLRGQFADWKQFRLLYSDGGHFRKPYPTNYLAAFLSTHILAALRVARRARVRKKLPPPVSASPLEQARMLNLAHHPENTFPVQEFKNSKFTATAVAVPVGSQIEMTMTDRPLLLEFVSAPQSCDLIFEKGGMIQRFRTLHKRVDSSEFGFLLLSAVLLRNDWQAPPGDCRIVIKAVPSDDDRTGFVPQYNLIPNTRQNEQFVYLTGLTTA
jgi:hypothetical protein